MEQVPKTVQARLQAVPPESHPDANLLTAFVERSLSKSERESVLQHLSQCSTCREVLALSLPEAAESPAVLASSSRLLSVPVLRWGTLAACAIIIAAGISLYYQGQGRREVSEQARAVVPPSAPAPSSAPAQTNAFADVTGAPEAKQAMPAESKRQSRSSRAHERNPESIEAAPAAEMAEATAPPLDKKSAAANLPAASGNETVSVQAEATPPVEDSELARGKAKEAVKDELAPRRDLAGATVSGMLARNKVAPAPMAAPVMAIPKSTPRWTLSSEGALQRSLDAGRSWQAISVPTFARLRAVAAQGTDLWVGGDAGTLYHSTDAGEHWAQVKPVANGTPLSADIIGVEFTDLQHGKLTTADQNTWMTSDGGQSWQIR